jgi:CBS domain-containing protein
MRIEGITLFVFGGVARSEGEPPSPSAEFFIAAAGPVSSVVLGIIFYLIRRLTAPYHQVLPVSGVAGYLAILNWLLAGFNLLPGYPLDGGRILRAALWQWSGRIKWATRIASRFGVGFGYTLVALGVVQVFMTNVIGGLWWVFIGLFLQGAARSSYQQLLTLEALEGEPIRRLMNPRPVTVPAGLSIGKIVEDYVYKYHFKMYPVVEQDRLVGCVTTRQIGSVARDLWARTTVGDIATDCRADALIDPDTETLKALSIMNRTGQSRLVVTDHGKLAGVLTLKDIMQFLALKLELNDEPPSKEMT